MKSKNMKQLLIIFLWVSALVACNPTSKEYTVGASALSATSIPTQNAIQTHPANLIPINGCIPPLHTFAYKTRQDDTSIHPGVNLIIPPTSPWQAALDMPTPKNQGNISLYKREINVMRVAGGHAEIWVRNFFQNYPTYVYSYSVYSSDTQKWREVSGEVADHSEVFVAGLFVAHDGSLWGQNSWEALVRARPRPESLTAYPLLSKYNEETGRFEFDQSVKGIPAGWYSDDLGTIMDEILLGPDGVFWFLVHKDAIYSYNPTTHAVRRHAEIPDQEVRYATIAPDGKIYYNIVTPPSQKGLFYFNPETGEVKGIDLTYSVYDSYLPRVFVDHSGRLWLGGLGWREPDERTWYRLLPSPIFIVNGSEDPSTYWQNPSLLIESSDGRFWFSSDNGMAWLDLQKEEWCWFTTYQSNIVEDQQNNLWMMADGKLYKYQLKP